jgi:SSS family solute:Na+ symporter
MNMHAIDWAIVACFFVFIVAMAWRTNKYTRSVADFLAANRGAGRYLLAICAGVGAYGATAFVAEFEMGYESGFVLRWWEFMMIPAYIIIHLSGWVMYRYRETRSLTLAQFFEVRYSKRFRVFAGIFIFLAGIINFGIFPAVGTRFFIYFCGLPPVWHLFGLEISTYVSLLIVLLGIALFFTFWGGVIAVMVADFAQGAFVNIALLVLLAYFMFKFDWAAIMQGLATAPRDASMLNPMHTSKVPDFNFWYYLIAIFGLFYGWLAWQGTSAYYASPKNPHEGKMGIIVGYWRSFPTVLIVTLLPVCAYVVLHNPAFSSIAASAKASLDSINPDVHDAVRVQMTTPIVLSKILPAGIMGLFCSVVFAAFITNHNTYLHSWGTILIQDVVIPLRKKPLSPKAHILLLKLSILAVAIFIFLFSWLFRQTQHIVQFWLISGTIWGGGGGAVIIGGLYTRRGNTAGAYSAIIVGCTLAVAGLVLEQVWKNVYHESFPVHGQWVYLIANLSSLVTYFAVSWLTGNEEFNLERMLHRGQYAIKGEHAEGAVPEFVRPRTWRERLGITKEFTRGDKIIYAIYITYQLSWILVFAAGSVYNFIWGMSDNAWARFWHTWLIVQFAIASLTSVWLIVGGISNMKDLFHMLRTAKRDSSDDGSVSSEAVVEQRRDVEQTVNKL